MLIDVLHPARHHVLRVGTHAPRHVLDWSTSKVEIREVGGADVVEVDRVTLRHRAEWPLLAESTLPVLMHAGIPYVPLHDGANPGPAGDLPMAEALRYLGAGIGFGPSRALLDAAFRATPVREAAEEIGEHGCEIPFSGRPLYRKVFQDGHAAARATVVEYLSRDLLVHEGTRLLRRFRPVLRYDRPTRSWGFEVGRPEPFHGHGGFGHAIDRPDEAEAFEGDKMFHQVRREAARLAGLLPDDRDPLDDVRLGLARVAALASGILRRLSEATGAVEARAAAIALEPVQLQLRMATTPDCHLADAILALRRALVVAGPPPGRRSNVSLVHRWERCKLGRAYLHAIAGPRIAEALAPSPEDAEAIGALAP